MAVRGGGERHVSWRQLDDRVRRLAAGFARIGVAKGQRVSVLVPPGPTLTAVVYACLRIGAVVVVADAGLGVRGLSRAVRGAWPDVIIGEAKGLCRGTRAGLAGHAHLGREAIHGIRRAAEGLAQPLRDPRPGYEHSPPGGAPARRSRRDPLHLRLNRPREGRRVHASPAVRAARHSRRALRGDPRDGARDRLCPVRPARPPPWARDRPPPTWMSRHRGRSPHGPSPPRCAHPMLGWFFCRSAAANSLQTLSRRHAGCTHLAPRGDEDVEVRTGARLQ